MDKSLNIVIAAPRFPYPLDRGDRITVYNLLRFFSQRHTLSLLCFLEPDQDPTWVEKVKPFCAEVVTVPLSKPKAYANSLRGVFGKTPLQVRYYRDPAMTEAMDALVARQKPDLLYAHTIRMGQYTESFRDTLRVLALQISMTLNYRRLAEQAQSPLNKLLYGLEYRKLRSFEGPYAQKFDKVLLISPHDLKAIEHDPPVEKTFFSPHGVSFEHFMADPGIEKDPRSIIFTGNMGYAPNVDAARYFYEDIFPLVRAKIPKVQWSVVGTEPAPEISKMAEDPAVTVTGRVPDLRDYMNRAQVAIDPLRVGAGLQNKVLEGMAMGLPMVVTSVANEGIQATHGENILVADDRATFAQHIVTLLEDAEKRVELGRAARASIVEQWSWEKHFKDLETMFAELVR